MHQLTLAEIGAIYGVSRQRVSKRAQEKGWTRDLSKAVRQAVKAKLIEVDTVDKVDTVDNQGLDRTVDSSNAKAAIETAATRGAGIILLQRRDIATLRDQEARLLDELGGNPTKLYITQYQGQIVQESVGIPVTERAAALQALANVQHKRIQLERQAYNLDDEDRQAAKLIVELD